MSASEKQAAVFILLGQSNAVGHGIPMEPADYIHTPLQNVFGLSRTLNQAYHNETLRWSGYTSCDMNLAEQQDDTYSVANCLARQWQDEIDAGNPRNLPDLYILHIAIGAQGITEKFMWYPDRPETLTPGVLGTVDISLYPFTMQILSLLESSFAAMGKTPVYLGYHWRGGEEETAVPVEQLEPVLTGLYHRMIADFAAALGKPIPWIMHRIVSPDSCNENDLRSMNYVNSVFEALAEEYPDVFVFDARRCPEFIPDVRGNGMFMEDLVHFTPSVNRWVAEQIRNDYPNCCVR